MNKVVRVEIASQADIEAINQLTPAERRDVLVEAGMQKASRVAGRVSITVQWASSEYHERIPESAWYTVKKVHTVKGLLRVLQEGISGQVRYIDTNGEVVSAESAKRLLQEGTHDW